MESQAVVPVPTNPLKFALYEKDNETDPGRNPAAVLLPESWQHPPQSDEHFYGCGMQNGYFFHRGPHQLHREHLRRSGDGAGA